MRRPSQCSPSVRSRLNSKPAIPFRHNRPLHVMITLLVLVWGGLALFPVDRKAWLLENGVLLLFIIALMILYRTYKFSNLSYFFITIFCILHMIGAHYAYKNTPIDIWIKPIFDTKRSVYDWLVHFAYGLLIAYPIREFIAAFMRLQSFWLYTITFSIIMGSSALFEIAEMCVVVVADPKLAEEYLGLQGDLMDTQKDMAMNLIGVMLSIGLMAMSGIRRKKSDAS